MLWQTSFIARSLRSEHCLHLLIARACLPDCLFRAALLFKKESDLSFLQCNGKMHNETSAHLTKVWTLLLDLPDDAIFVVPSALRRLHSLLDLLPGWDCRAGGIAELLTRKALESIHFVCLSHFSLLQVLSQSLSYVSHEWLKLGEKMEDIIGKCQGRIVIRLHDQEYGILSEMSSRSCKRWAFGQVLDLQALAHQRQDIWAELALVHHAIALLLSSDEKTWHLLLLGLPLGVFY